MSDQITSNVGIEIAEIAGAEAQRAGIEFAKLAEPKAVESPKGEVVLSFDEREMLRNARDGVSWPEGTLEAMTCEYLERHGLLRDAEEGWELTEAGAALADLADADAETMSGKPDFFTALGPVDLEG